MRRNPIPGSPTGRVYSQATSQQQLPAIFKLVERAFGWEPGTVNLDVGGGVTDQGTEYLADRDVENLILDDNRSEAHNRKVLTRLDRLVRRQGGADTATISNVYG